MALHPKFPMSPHAILNPALRWFPADETLRDTSMEKLIPPLVAELRKKVQTFRDSGYVGASETSRSLLTWWFKETHMIPQADGTSVQFQYYFAQREAIETIIYLYEVAAVRHPYDLLKFDSSKLVSTGMFEENWLRFVIKMATGSGKTKVMSLVLAWSYFHKLYEQDSELSRNFLLITPNIIVLDRIYKDFHGLRIFYDDPVLPDNGYDGRDWHNDFQLTLHKQDEVRITHPFGNIFLTNIHRVYSNDDVIPTKDDENTKDYFLRKRPTGATTDSNVDLGIIVRDIDELMVINDEAHHIHDASLAWFKSIQDIHNRLVQKGCSLSLQIDVTATPKHNNGAIFVQTISDYPLVEAIYQNVVKHPVIPDEVSRSKLVERQSAKFTEKYADFLDLGVIEWRKAYEEHRKLGKKAILFVMTDDTRNCDDVAEYLEGHYPDFKDAVLVIHTKNNGEISESSSQKAKEELERLRSLSNSMDDEENPYKVIVSVLMLKEGWDVRNVTTIVGLRAYSAKSNILPEQTLGRGLRKMYRGNAEEKVSVIGTEAFMDFVASIEAEGVKLERAPMGDGTDPKAPMVVEIDSSKKESDIDKLDMEIPMLSPRTYREYKNLADLDVSHLEHTKLQYKEFTEEEQREIVFKDITSGEISHTTMLDSAGLADYRNVVGYFAQTIMRELHLVGGYNILYGKVKEFISKELFTTVVDIESQNTLRNLSELEATVTIFNTLKKGINDLTVRDKGTTTVKDTIKLRKVRPFIVKDQESLPAPKKSIFNRIVGDSGFELRFAAFLEKCKDVISYTKNYYAVNFKIDYVTVTGEISNYYPDFIVKLSEKEFVIVETKGKSDLDVPRKMERLKQWCEDVNAVQDQAHYDFLFVEEAVFTMFNPKNFRDMLKAFTEYK